MSIALIVKYDTQAFVECTLADFTCCMTDCAGAVIYSCTERFPDVSHLLTCEQCLKNLSPMQTHVTKQKHISMTAQFSVHNTWLVTTFTWWKFVTWKALLLFASDELLRQLCPMQLGIEVVDGVISIIEGPLVAIKPNAVV